MTVIPEASDPFAWLARAACRNVSADDFFPDGPETAPAVAEQVERAKQVCAACPVRTECLEFAVAEKFGIWGGTTETERQAERRRNRRAA